MREPGRSLLREAILENEYDVHAAYQLAKEAQRPIAYLIEIVKRGDHRGLGIETEQDPCRHCRQTKPDVRDRRQVCIDRQGHDPGEEYLLCDSCTGGITDLATIRRATDAQEA